jgi:raffinose/stachyose/melibiose transport system substrate-binding protein
MESQMKVQPNRSRASKITVTAVAASLLLAGCSSAGDSTASGSSAPITFWYGLETVDAKSEAIWKKYNLEPFEKQHPDVKVNAIPQSSAPLPAKIKTALAAGQAPDFIETAGSATAIPYATAGYLADLTKNAETEGWKDKFLPWALDMGYIDGKLEAVPTSYESMVLYYNKTLFKKNGWTPPTDRASLEKLAEEMKGKGIVPFTAGNASYTAATEWLVSSFLNEVAGPAKIHDALAGKVPWTDPAIVSAITLLKKYFDKGYFGGGVKQYFTTQDPQKYAQFADGKAGMFISGSWEMLSLGEYFGVDGNKNDWAWTTLPPLAAGVPSGSFPLSVGGTMSINAKAKNPSAAFDYMNWLFSDTKNMWNYVAAGEAEPFPIKYSDADVPKEVDPRYAEQYKQLNLASESRNVGYVTWTSFGPKMESYVLSEEDKVVNGSLSPEAFCAGLQKEFEADNKAGLIPPLFDTNG